MGKRRIAVIVLAAGLGKRLRSTTAKVLQSAAGKPLIHHVLGAIGAIGPAEHIFVVVGHGKEQVRASVNDAYDSITFVEQPELRGTADAVKRCAPHLADFDGDVLVLPGDTPLLKNKSISLLLQRHREGHHHVSLLTAHLQDPSGYGRVIRGPDGKVDIVEEADANDEQKRVTLISGGFWCFDSRSLFQALDEVTANNAQGEFYLPDAALVISRSRGMLIVELEDPDEVKGVNDRNQLAEASMILRRRIIEELGLAGVTFEDPATTFIDEGVTIGTNTVIRPLTFLEGTTTIGADCTIGPSTRIVDSTIADGTEVTFAVVKGSVVGPGCQVGPFASIRPGTELKQGAKVGTFVELKATTVGKGSKVPHLSYIGDATIGADVNIGAGTITCNYDGETKIKSKTVIEDGVLTGSDSMLVAPVTLGRDSVTAAGSVVTRDIAPGDVVVGVPAKPVRKRKPKPG
ncbi:MAG: bifunctional UDP-N-acetylglucosamine diphosphorylase/glucosamine-1-phosphate N-acetyltransferase GlmU [Actinomycetota bacterium]